MLEKHAPTPFLSDADKAYDDSSEPKGVLRSCASKIIMKVLYGARMCRYDLLHACQALACTVTKWSLRCDRRLHRMIAYIHQTIDLCMFGWMGDAMDHIRLWLYTDADFAADQLDSKSVSGVFCALHGPTSHFPLCTLSKKQSAVSHSTTESEIVAADLGLRTEALPFLTLLDSLFHIIVRCLFLEDNQSTLRNVTTGANQSLRHMNRTHRVNCHSISETCREQPIYFGACESHLMAADMFTNIFTNCEKLVDVMRLIAHLFWADFLRLFNKGNMPFPDTGKKTATLRMEDGSDGSVMGRPTNNTTLQITDGRVEVQVSKPLSRTIHKYVLEWCCILTN